MAQSDARFGYRAKLARTDHDLSRKMGFTCPPGFLLPIFQDIATPGDTYYINHDLEFLRTRQMAAPAMVDLKVHFESFFVPAQMVYQPLENTVFSLKNLQSNLYDSTNLRNNLFPLFDYNGYVSNINATEARSSLKHNAFRLADLLELNPWIFAQDSANIPRFDFAPAFFPWQLLTYHTIFYYYYRLDDKQDMLVNLCNWDSSYNATQPVYSALKDFMNIHPRPWAFDYHTSIYWSPLVSASNMQDILPAGPYGDFFASSVNDIGPISRVAGTPSNNNAISSFVGSQASATIMLASNSVASIRQMFANEKLAMITGRTRKTYDSQVLAHFGVEVPHDVKHDLTLIGHDTFPIHVGEVTSLSATDDASLGDLAGKGWSQGQGKRIKFTAPCHGFIMTIFSIEPEQMYYGGFNKINAITNAFDIPTPEFDRLGNQPMFRYEAGTKGSTQTAYDIIGWKERYYPYKRRKNLVSIAFEDRSRAVGLYNDMVSYFIASPAYQNFDPTRGYGRPDLQNIYIINPHCMDNLMLVPYVNEWIDGTAPGETVNWNASPWLAYSTDPFIVNTFEKVTKVSWMSKDGEPVYDF